MNRKKATHDSCALFSKTKSSIVPAAGGLGSFASTVPAIVGGAESSTVLATVVGGTESSTVPAIVEGALQATSSRVPNIGLVELCKLIYSKS